MRRAVFGLASPEVGVILLEENGGAVLGAGPPTLFYSWKESGAPLLSLFSAAAEAQRWCKCCWNSGVIITCRCAELKGL